MRNRLLTTLALCSVALAAAFGPRAARAEIDTAPTGFADPSATIRMDLPLLDSLRFAIGRAARQQRAGDATIRAAVASFYEQRDDRPLWVDSHGLTDRGAAAIEVLSRAGDDGLDPTDYLDDAFVSVAASPPGTASAADLAKAEVALSDAVVLYARQLQAGRVPPSQVSSTIHLHPVAPDPGAVLRALSDTDDPVRVLAHYRPPQPQYAALRQALAAIDDGTKPTGPRIPDGPTLTVGSTDSRVPLLRERLGVSDPSGADPDLYDDTLASAVRDFQRSQGLTVDGVVGPGTLAALNRDSATGQSARETIVANMERWRWMPRHLGAHAVLVNIPAYSVEVLDAGTVVHRARVIVGRPDKQTPLLASAIDHIIVNPYWNIPFSIASNEMLADIERNPRGYLDRHNYEVLYNGKVVDPASLDWSKATLREVRIRQRPGRGNALGRILFMFPNDEAVYLHDTSAPSLFARTKRDLSHGCVRVDNPFAFADSLLGTDPNLNAAKLKTLVGGPQHWLSVKDPVPVYLAYFTATVDPAGRLHLYDDVYGLDARTRAALGQAGA